MVTVNIILVENSKMQATIYNDGGFAWHVPAERPIPSDVGCDVYTKGEFQHNLYYSYTIID